jgi:hypothetical protein
MPKPYTEQDKESKRRYYQQNKERILKQKAQYFLDNKDQIYQRRQERVTVESREARQQYMEKYRKQNKDRRRKPDKEKIKLSNRSYYQRHKEELRIKHREYRKQRMLIDPSFRTKMLLRNLLYRAFQKYSTTGKIMSSKKYGINYQAIIDHLGSCPVLGYHIDHIIPLSLFDFDNAQHIMAAFAPENHQWLSSYENLRKSDRCDHRAFEAYLRKFDGGYNL